MQTDSKRVKDLLRMIEIEIQSLELDNAPAVQFYYNGYRVILSKDKQEKK